MTEEQLQAIHPGDVVTWEKYRTRWTVERNSRKRRVLSLSRRIPTGDADTSVRIEAELPYEKLADGWAR